MVLLVHLTLTEVLWCPLRYTPQSVELEHSLKPFIPDFIPAVGDIDAFLKVQTYLGFIICPWFWSKSRAGWPTVEVLSRGVFPVCCSGAKARRESG